MFSIVIVTSVDTILVLMIVYHFLTFKPVYRLSDIIAIHLVNPITNEFEDVTNLTEPITFAVPLTATPSVQTLQYMVR